MNKLNRLELVDKLKMVSPALANNSIIPILTHLWLTGGEVMAYNDKIAISVPCKTDGVDGAVPSQLLSLLQTSPAKSVSLQMTDHEMVTKAGSATFRLGVIPKDDFIFDMPRPNKKHGIINKALLTAIKNCMRSVTLDAVKVQQMGITISGSDGRLTLYSTNAVSITKAKAKIDKWTGPELDKVVIPGMFCQTLLELAKEDETELVVEEDYILAITGNGTRLFGRLLAPDQYLDFDKVIAEHYSKKQAEKAIAVTDEIHDALKQIFDRACITADIDVKRMFTEISIESNGKATFFTKAGMVEVTDELELPKHPNVKKVCIEPTLLRDGLEICDNILFSDKAAVMEGKNVLYLVGSTSAKG